MSDTKIHPVLDEEKSMHERMANLPDIPELPQCTCQTLAISHNPAIPPKKVLCLVCSAFQEMNITREEYATMRAAVDDMKDVREALNPPGASKVGMVVSPAEEVAGMWEGLCAWRDKARAAVDRCAELETELARVTAERDAARACAVEIRDSLHDEQSSVDELLRKKT